RVDEAAAIVGDLECRIAAERGQALPAPAPAPVSPAIEHPGRTMLRDIFAPRYRRRTIMLSLFNAAQVIGFYGFNSWVPTLLMARGIDLPRSLEYSLIIALSQPLGPLIGALFADRVER